MRCGKTEIIKTAMTRNRLVAEMADAVVVAHATRGGKMDTLCGETLATGKRVAHA